MQRSTCKLSMITKTCIAFLKQSAKILSEHFPERCGTILVVNVPGWFNLAWKIAMPLLPEATKKKVRVARGDKDIKALFEEIAPMDQVPRRYGGTKDITFDEFCSTDLAEVKLREYVHKLNTSAGYKPPQRAADGRVLGPWKKA